MYIAFFQYPGEEGRVQNRIEDIWVTVHDRARETGRVSTALFNRVAAIVQRLFNRMFGTQVFSLHLISVSVNLSLAVPLVLLGLAGYSLGIQSGVKEVESHGLLYLLAAAATMICASVAIWRPRIWILIVAALPPFILLSLAGSSIDMTFDTFESTGLWIGASLVSDLIALAVIKWSLGSIAVDRSLPTILMRVLGVTGIVLLVIWAPMMYPGAYDLENSVQPAINGMAIFMMNVSTALYCLIPFSLLVFVLVHRATWPVLSRLLFPIARFELVKNRKAMAVLGLICILLGLGLKEATLEAILKLFE